jgi:hypothetical protein
VLDPAFSPNSRNPNTGGRWVDNPLWHIPCLVQPTSLGAVKVCTEEDRRQAVAAAGDSNDGANTEPGWHILKMQLAMSHQLANTGRGLAYEAAQSESISSPYSSHNSIFSGWSLSDNSSGDWQWDKVCTCHLPD